MVKKVIKKSGKKQVFDSKKIKRCISKLCKSTKLSKNEADVVKDEILQEVLDIAEKREITTAEIRDIALRNLNTLDPAVVRAWIAFEILKLQRRRRA